MNRKEKMGRPKKNRKLNEQPETPDADADAEVKEDEQPETPGKNEEKNRMFYVGSGNTFLGKHGVLYHSGKQLPPEMIDVFKNNTVLDKYIRLKRIVEGRPVLDAEKDKETGSKKIEKINAPRQEPKVLPEPKTSKSDS